jgi:hypothetical protein
MGDVTTRTGSKEVVEPLLEQIAAGSEKNI